MKPWVFRWSGYVDYEFWKTEDKDRVSLEDEMKGSEAKKKSQKNSGGRAVYWLQNTGEIWWNDVNKVIKLGKHGDFLIL